MLQKPQRVSIIIPAHEEAKWISPVLKTAMEAREAGIVQDVIVVDDGSKDATSEVARRVGATVIRLKERVGKGGAVLEGLQQCHQLGTDIVVTLDADFINLNLNHLRELLDTLNRPTEKEMAIGSYFEGRYEGVATNYLSGFRAIRMRRLRFIFNYPESTSTKRFLSRAQGFGWESAINQQFGLVAQVRETDEGKKWRIFKPNDRIIAREQLEGAVGHLQLQELGRVASEINKRRREIEAKLGARRRRQLENRQRRNVEKPRI